MGVEGSVIAANWGGKTFLAVKPLLMLVSVPLLLSRQLI